GGPAVWSFHNAVAGTLEDDPQEEKNVGLVVDRQDQRHQEATLKRNAEQPEKGVHSFANRAPARIVRTHRVHAGRSPFRRPKGRVTFASIINSGSGRTPKTQYLGRVVGFPLFRYDTAWDEA